MTMSPIPVIDTFSLISLVSSGLGSALRRNGQGNCRGGTWC